MKTKIEPSAAFLALMATAVLLIPLKWLIAWVAAAVFHEICHLAAMWCFRCKVHSIKIAPNGAIMEGEPLQDIQGLLCEAAGPIGSFALLLTARWLPTVALCGFIQGVFNLLPFHPLDGYKLLNRLLAICLPSPWNSRMSLTFRVLTAFLLIIFGIRLYKIHYGFLPLLIAIIVVLNDCKNSLQKHG